MPEQYVRTCKSCGNTWYSLLSREKKLTAMKSSYNMEVCCRTCDFFDCGGRAKAEGNKNSVDHELSNLQKCPKCGSSNYVQITQKF
jgi:predicted nucleic-acid-binding Zn-ribbon protein